MVTQIEAIQKGLEEAGLSEQFDVKDYGNGGFSVEYFQDGEKVTFASNMGVPSNSVIYHYTGKPEIFTDETTNQIVRTIVNDSYTKDMHVDIPDESWF